MNKQQLWKYIKQNYAYLYFIGFGILGMSISLIAAVYVLRGWLVLPTEIYGFIVLMMSAWFFVRFWFDTAEQVKKKSSLTQHESKEAKT